MTRPITLTASYEHCRRVNARHGRSFYLATLLLPEWKRRHVHALYGFARHVDDVVDATGPGSRAGRAAALDGVTARLEASMAGEPVRDPVLPAFVHTVRSFGIEHGDIEAFMSSMRADLTVTRYDTYRDLLAYMEGSAAAIGLMMLPVLETVPGAARTAREPAAELGRAFQLTNFLRDVAEDLARDRIYLPLEDMRKFGVREAELERGGAGPGMRELVAFEAERARLHYRRAREGIEMLVPSSRPCIRAAAALYGGILDEIAAVGHDVLGGRARVPRRRRAAIYVRHLVAASAAARAERRPPPAGSRHGRAR
ncbi:phytoene/squalene synthase family protein [Actinomadura sp. WMMB 499]|uniref:phytoene/squalene synthase family protein n=1 Tax=Actinomadura sp. WMMB 499 TaxID=1219491 RepID=UPI0012470FE6|nr:phytoene/squalene synthase family protein [Actinomadura sp. WMMB 499]QFG22439.1 phytoene/squalene synthase family protein [Actinomadura sp. WMMB 499]